MYGAILGDIIGSPFEFDRGDKTKNFDLFSEGCGFTDDSVMTIAVGEALMAVGPEAAVKEIEDAVASNMQDWGKRYPHAGYGGSFRHWLKENNPKPYESYGNGSAMRVSAAGWLYDSIERTREVARATANECYQDSDKSWKRRFEGYKYIHHMKIEFASDNKKLGQVLYALAHSSLKPEFSIEYTVADVEKCKNELLHKANEDSIQKAQVLTTAANVKLGEIQAIDYSWGEIDFVTKPMNEMRLMECTECEMSAPAAYDIDIEADDIDVTDTVTVVWEIA